MQNLTFTGASRRIDSIYGNSVLICDRIYSQGDVNGAYVSQAYAGGHTANWQYTATWPYCPPAYVHRDSCNFAFKDGHVQSFKYTGVQLFDRNYVQIR